MQYLSIQLASTTPTIELIDTNFFNLDRITRTAIDGFYNWIVFDNKLVGICITFLDDHCSPFRNFRFPYLSIDEQTTVWFDGFSTGEQLSNQDFDLSFSVDVNGNVTLYASLWDIDPTLYKQYIAKTHFTVC